MKKLKLNLEALEVEQFQTEPGVEEEGTVLALSGWYSAPCLYCLDYPISVTPNSAC
jgi:hypothetical protein